MAYCFDQFVITVVGGIVNCDVTKSSLFYEPTYQAPTFQTAQLTIPFSYKVGAPPRTKFVSEYIKSRTGGTGSPPSIISRIFDPAGPHQGGAPNEPFDATLTVIVPIYDQAQANQLGAEGFDTHSIKIIIAEASDIVGN